MGQPEQPSAITADVYPFSQLTSPLEFTVESFQRLAEGRKTSEMAATLESGLFILKKLQLLHVLREVRSCYEADFDSSIEELADMSLYLLDRAEEAQPGIMRTLLRGSSVQGWLHRAAEQLQDSHPTAETFAGISGELSALAAVAACRTKLSFSCRATLQHGALYFPTLGKLFLKEVATEPITQVVLQSSGDGALHVHQGEKVITVPGPNVDTTDWRGERQYDFECDGRHLSVILDDLAPGFPEEPVRRLTTEEAERWHALLERSWGVAVRKYPQAAQELSGGLDAIKPLLDSSTTIGAASRNHIGAIALRMPADEDACVEAWIHEYGGHNNLNSLEKLLSLFAADAPENSALAYAPWRDDPRPVKALLHGCYSFMQVAGGVWQQRMDEDEPSGTLAQFEYLRWLTFVKKGAEQLEQRARLTKNGRLFLETMLGHIRSLPTDRVGEVPRAMATAAVADHAALWRAHHLQVPDTSLLEAAVAAWRNNEDPPAGLWQTSVELRPNTQQAINFRARANLFRQAIKDPYSLHDPEARTPLGSMPADVHYVLGDTERAEDAYLQTLTQPHRSLGMRALIGFGLVRMAAEDPAAQVILGRPELIRELMRYGRVKPNELHALASWVRLSVQQQPLEL